MAEKSRPGVMLYFDTIYDVAVKVMNNEQAGKLFKAILMYSKDGEISDDWNDVLVSSIFLVIKSNIDRDADRYTERIIRNKYGGYKSVCERKNIELLSYEEWYSQVYLTTPESSQPNTITNTTPTTNPNTNSLGKAKAKGCGEKERENPDFNEDDFETKRQRQIAKLADYCN